MTRGISGSRKAWASFRLDPNAALFCPVSLGTAWPALTTKSSDLPSRDLEKLRFPGPDVRPEPQVAEAQHRMLRQPERIPASARPGPRRSCRRSARASARVWIRREPPHPGRWEASPGGDQGRSRPPVIRDAPRGLRGAGGREKKRRQRERPG